jgi:hypothetical protein
MSLLEVFRSFYGLAKSLIHPLFYAFDVLIVTTIVRVRINPSLTQLVRAIA